LSPRKDEELDKFGIELEKFNFCSSNKWHLKQNVRVLCLGPFLPGHT
jgi:hypothetical protein